MYPSPTHVSCLGKARTLVLRYLLESPRSGHSQAAVAPAVESDPAGKQRLFVLPGWDLSHPETSPRSLSRASVCDQGPPDDLGCPCVPLDQSSWPGH